MSETPDILLQIAQERRERVWRHGAAQGINLPSERTTPLVPFGGERDILIAEIKRKSPSKGAIAEIPYPSKLALRYKNSGFRRISVLTEEAYFGGSLAILAEIKSNHPDLAILRKDFLLSVEDVEISYRAGADAILLIAALLSPSQIDAMFRRAQELGLSVLMEVHTAQEVDKVRPLQPPLIGINCRNLHTFTVDPIIPLEVRTHIDWSSQIIYESGISHPEEALFIRGTDFGGFLVGEAVAREPNLAENLITAWNNRAEARRLGSAWERLYFRYTEGVPLVKICGITNLADAKAAVKSGADMIGFVLSDSPRQTDAGFIRECAGLGVLKAAVVVLGSQDPVPAEVEQLLKEGMIDFIQFHGSETPQTVRSWPSYKAISLQNPEDANRIPEAGSPAVLVDTFSPDKPGGTGKQLDKDLIEAAARRRTLWLAGGLTPENVGEIVREWKPGLVDVSSGVEAAPGKKDHKAMNSFIRNAKNP